VRIPKLRPVRAFFSIGFIGAGLWGVSPSLTVTPSIDSVVNAEVTVVRSVTEGRIEGGPPAVGAHVRTGELIARVVNERQDRSFLGELATERASLVQRIEALLRQKYELEETSSTLEFRVETYRQNVAKDLEHRIAEARSSVAAIEATLSLARKNKERRAVLAERDLVSRADFDVVRFEVDRLVAERSAAESRVRSLETHLAAMAKGAFLSDGQNDVPYSQQRLDEIGIRMSDIVARHSEYAIRVDEISRQIDVENDRLKATRMVTHQAPVGGIVWKRFVKPGNDVVIGTELAEVADCSSVFLDATFDENLYGDLAVGQRAKVRFLGEDRRFDAIVRAIRGSGAVTEDRLLAARTKPRGSGEFQVILNFDSQALGGDNDNFCLIGRKAEIVFPKKFATEGGRHLSRFVTALIGLVLPGTSFAMGQGE
jgi:multidrug resistance efflux pump